MIWKKYLTPLQELYLTELTLNLRLLNIVQIIIER